MRFVIVRDDDVNATTPPALLDRLYRPFLDRGLPVNLSVIPEVRTDIRLPNGALEGFLFGEAAGRPARIPIARSSELATYLSGNSGYHVLQHGLSHELVNGAFEFDREERGDIVERLERGRRLLAEAGFPNVCTFVGPQDRLSRGALKEVTRRYAILSTGWYEFRRLPLTWRPRYLIKRTLKRAHWRVGGTLLLTHPGCLLSRFHPYDGILDSVKRSIASRTLTVLVTHWWEYFVDAKPDDALTAILHETAAYLAESRDIRVISFDELASDKAIQRAACS